MRWTMLRKAQLLKDIEAGKLTDEEACSLHQLSPEELISWRRLAEEHGTLGLRATYLGEYRGDKEVDTNS